MITVACVYWKGKFRGRENVYTEEWVSKLRSMVARNLPIDHRFVCLSNVDVPCERVPLIHNWPGWWSKMELFRPDLFDNLVLYLDLDLIIVKDLRPFINFSVDGPRLAAVGGFGDRHRNREGKVVVGTHNSSVMTFWCNSLTVRSIYGSFERSAEAMMQEYRGDQDFISSVYPKLETYPVGWVSKLRDLPGRPKPKTKIVLCMAGGTMPKKNISAVEQYKWIKEIWQ